MTASANRAGPCECCGRPVKLNRHGLYRRHFAFEPDGSRHLCAASGRDPAGVARLLTAETTPDWYSYSHARRRLKGLS